MRFLFLVMPFLLLACPPSPDPLDDDDDSTPTAEPTPEPTPVEGAFRVDDTPRGREASGAQGIVASNGDIFVSWVDNRNGEPDLFVARSTDGGAVFEAPVMVDGPNNRPVTGWMRAPFLTVSEDRVALVWNTSTPNSTYASVSSRAGVLDFGTPVEVGTPGEEDFEDFAKGAFAPDGQLWVVWHGALGQDHWLELAREDQGWTRQEIGGDAPGIPCECCPLDLQFLSNGDAVVAYRNDLDDIREQYLLIAPAATGVFSQVVLASSNQAFINYCPVQGPRLHEAGPRVYLTWNDKVDGVMKTWFGRSGDLAQTWSTSRAVAPSLPGTQRDARIVVDGTTVHLAWTAEGQGSVWARSDDGGDTFGDPVLLEVPGGTLEAVELIRGPAVLAAVGIGPNGTVWILHL